jgi:CBS domain-containing protein
MIVAQAMKKIVITAFPSTTLRELWHIIFVRKINSVPIVDQHQKLIGIISKDDLLTHLYSNYEEYISDFETAADFDAMEKRVKNIGKMTAGEIMKREPVFTRTNTHIMRALSRMIVRHVNQLPVLSDDDKLVGIITKGDIFKVLFKKRLSPAFR